MKKIKVSLLALAVVAGGAIGASAASSKTTEGDSYGIRLLFPSNAPLSFILVNAVAQGAAALTISNATFEGVVTTDGSGKIDGAGFERIRYGVLTTNGIVPAAISDYNVNVSGKISTKNNLPSVQESLKGTGFSSTTNVVLNGTNGPIIIIKSPQSGSSSFSVNFTANSAVISSNSILAGGTLKGTIKPGINAINGGKTIQVNEGAILPVELFTLTEGDFQVVQFGNKFWANGVNFPFSQFNGSGSSSSNGKFNYNAKGFGQASGSSFKLSGTGGQLIIVIGGVTNTVVAISSADLSGKIAGQSVSVKGVTSRAY
jgi:hypothetical protein